MLPALFVVTEAEAVVGRSVLKISVIVTPRWLSSTIATSSRDQTVVDVDVDRLTQLAVQLDHGTATELKQPAYQEPEQGRWPDSLAGSRRRGIARLMKGPDLDALRAHRPCGQPQGQRLEDVLMLAGLRASVKRGPI